MNDTACKIKVDCAEVHAALKDISSIRNSELPKEVIKAFFDQVFRLFHGGLLNDCILFLGTATVAGDHIIRLGVGGDLKHLATAARTRKFDFVLIHD